MKKKKDTNHRELRTIKLGKKFFLKWVPLKECVAS